MAPPKRPRAAVPLLLALIALASLAWLSREVRERFADSSRSTPSDPGGVLVPASEPRLAFERSTLELGRVYRGSDLEVEFPFEVRADVAVYRLGVSCGCLEARLETQGSAGFVPGVLGNTMTAGTRGRVVVALDTATRSERGRLRVSVLSDDPEHPRVGLALLLDLERHFLLEPDLVTENEVPSTELLTATLRVSATDAERAEFRGTRNLPEGWTLEPKQGAAAPGGLALELRAPYTSEKAVQGTFDLLVHSDAVDRPWPVRVRVFAGRTEAVTIVPRTLLFDRLAAGVEHVLSCELRTPLEDAVLHVEQVQFDEPHAPFLDAEVESLDGGRALRLDVVLGADLSPGDLRAEMFVRTNLSSEVLRVRIAGRIEPQSP